MKKTAAIYARVSSERQKEEGTIASQTALLLEHAKVHELTVPSEWIFEDEGYSGAVLARPGLERLRDLAAEGQVEVVLIYAPDRLSRKYAYQVLLLEEFSRHGVETIFLKAAAAETPEERLMLQFQGMIAEYERAQIAERTRRGKRHRAKSGCVNVLSGAPYGYRYIKKSEQAQACYEVVEAQAEVVRKETFALAQERLTQNKQISLRNTREPTLLQGLLVCEQCGYALYRTSTRTTRRQIKYYRCLGSDRYRHLRGPVCTNRPIRQDYLDEFVWSEIIRLLDDPDLVQAEIDRRRAAARNADP